MNNFSLAFAREYINAGKLSEGRKLLIIRAAVGGTGFSDNHWGQNNDLSNRMHKLIEATLQLNSENKLVAFLWHQGETDAILNATEQTHYNNLKQLINSVRESYNSPSLPFITGDFVNEWKTKNEMICTPIINAIQRICIDLQPAAFIETSDLKSNNEETGNGDEIHFSREALNILGKRYFQAFINLVS
jgi:lysophospholipase L1-like esterase